MEVIRGEVKIPKDYFNRAAKKEYVFWARALIREFLQNSVDAGSSIIRFKFAKDRLSLVVQDDGCGMDKDIILNKLLALGGSHKQDGAVGGFGKAKEILFFAWSSYAIHTKHWLVQGEGSEYSLRQVDKYYNGTRCVINFYNEHEFNSALCAAIEYLPRNEVTADIYLNSNKITYAFGGVKKKVRQLLWGSIYTTPVNCDGVSIRVNGLEMFKHYTSGTLKEQVIVELDGYSTDILATNRDVLNYKYSHELHGFLNHLSINPLSAMINFNTDIQEIIGGNVISIPESLIMMWSEESGSITPSGIQGAYLNKSNFSFPNFKYEFVIRKSVSFDESRINEFISDPVAEPLAMLWSSLLFEIVVASKLNIAAFRAGFIFHNKVRGLCLDKVEFPTILFNPLSDDIISAEDISQLREVMEDIAYHELAHVKNRKHDEMFVLRVEQLRVNHRKWKRRKFSSRVLNWKNLLTE